MSLGSFIPKESLVHRVPAVWKFCIFIALVVLVILSKSFLVLGGAMVALLLAVAASNIGIKHFITSMKPLVWFILFLAVLQFFMIREGNVLIRIFGFPLYDQTLIIMARVTLRLAVLTGLSLLLTMTTSPIALSKGIETLGKPLKIIKFPVKDAALAFSIALRFVPVFLSEFQRISDARKARGFGQESFIKKIQTLTATIIPLLVSAIQHAEELGNALEIRGYSAGKTEGKATKEGKAKKDVLT